jgi:glycosyltransferase involved in cell wall biosynthesis
MAATLPAALTSLQRQTFTSWECIIVDDGSHDATGAISADWARRDHRFRLLSHPVALGIVSSLNAAAATACGHYLARQDGDDISHPHRLTRSVALLETNPDLALAACLVKQFPAADLQSGFVTYEKWLNSLVTHEQIAGDIWVESPIPHPSAVMRAEAFFACGGYCDNPWPEDYDLWLEMYGAGWQFAKVPEHLYYWRHHGQRLTLSDQRYRPEAFLACKLHHLSERLDERTLLIWGAGRDGHRLGRALQARGYEIESFIDIDPKKIGHTRLGAPVLDANNLGVKFAPGEIVEHTEKRPLVLVAVGARGARELIRSRLAKLSWREPDDFICIH